LGAGPAEKSAADDPLTFRRLLLSRHEGYCAALQAGDADAVMALLAEGVQGAVRDYVNDTGTLTGLEGSAANRAFYASLFRKYEILGVDLLHRVAQEWYLFAELRMTVRPRDGSSGVLAFNTAEFFIPARDGRFILHVGHGTDPAIA
jgi:hypothetical protein